MQLCDVFAKEKIVNIFTKNMGESSQFFEEFFSKVLLFYMYSLTSLMSLVILLIS
jgi:hypothetical protein